MSLQPGPQDPTAENAPTPPDEGVPGYGPPPPVDGWASPPPPAPGYPYAPPPPQPPGSDTGPPQGYPPSGYPPAGYQAVGYPAARQTDSKAVVALILAISSWLICPFITAVAALVLSGQSNRAIDASGGQLEGRSMNTATKVIAWINIVLSVLALIAVVIALVFFAATDPSVITDFSEESTQF